MALVLPSLVASIVLLFTYVESAGWRWSLSIGLVVATCLGLVSLVQQSRQAFGRIANGLAAARLGSDAHREAVPVNRELEHALAEIDKLCDILERQRHAADDARLIRQRFFELIPNPIFVFDEESSLRELNSAAAASLGASPAAVVGQSATSLGIDGVLANTKGRYELRLDGNDVERIDVFEGGQRLSFVFVQSQSSSDPSPPQRERGNWQHLFRVLVHEVNNSLTPIKAMADSLRIQLGEPLPQDWRTRFASSIEAIGMRAQRLSRFVDGYGEIAKIPNPEKTEIGVREWLTELVTLERRVKVHLEDGPSTTIVADTALLDQVVLNLLVNAAEASQSTDGEVRLRWSIDGDDFVLTVDDEGPGLAPGIDVFLPNVSTKERSSGLGLAVSREIAFAHGGTVDLEDRKDRRGCRATLRIPRDGVVAGRDLETGERIVELPRSAPRPSKPSSEAEQAERRQRS